MDKLLNNEYVVLRLRNLFERQKELMDVWGSGRLDIISSYKSTLPSKFMKGSFLEKEKQKELELWDARAYSASVAFSREFTAELKGLGVEVVDDDVVKLLQAAI